MDWDWMIGFSGGCPKEGAGGTAGGQQQASTGTWLSGWLDQSPPSDQALKTAERVAAALTADNMNLKSELELLKAAASEAATNKAALEEKASKAKGMDQQLELMAALSGKEKELVELQNQLNDMANKMNSMRQELLAAQAKVHALSIPPPAAAAGGLSTNSTASGGSRACSGGEETAALEVAVRLSLLRGQLAAAEVAAAKAKLANLSMRQDVSQEMEDMTAVQGSMTQGVVGTLGLQGEMRGLQGSIRHGVGARPSGQALTHFEGCLQLQGLLGPVVYERWQRRLRPPLLEAGQLLTGALPE
eukprot:gene11487-11631_t